MARNGSGVIGALELRADAVAVAVADNRCVASDRRLPHTDPARGRADVRLVVRPAGDAHLAVELAAVLADGACLVLPAATQRCDSRELAELVATYGVTHLTADPETLLGLARTGIPGAPTVQRWDVTGTEWSSELPGLLRALAPDSVASFSYRVPTYLGVVARGPVTGTGRARPVPGAEALVLDRLRRPVAPGVLGEVYVGGAALASECATAAGNFVTDPRDSSRRLFRTGAYARWTSDGRLILCSEAAHPGCGTDARAAHGDPAKRLGVGRPDVSRRTAAAAEGP
jgi:mycobactin peptide synthetase MbtE